MSYQRRKIKCHICNRVIRSDTLNRHLMRQDHRRFKKPITQCSFDENDSLPSEEENQNVIANYAWRDRGVEKNHNFLLPRNIRAIVVGKSGFGKSTLLNYLLLHPDILDYDTLTVCGRSLHQPEYRIMRCAFSKGLSKNQVNELFRNQKELNVDPWGTPIFNGLGAMW